MSKAGSKAETYTIAGVASLFGLTYRTLRFYEEKGLIHPRRCGTERLYTGGDLVRIRIILLGKRLGFSISEIGDLIDSNATDAPSGTVEDLGLSKDDIKDRIDLLTRQAKIIEDALAELRTACVPDDGG